MHKLKNKKLWIIMFVIIGIILLLSSVFSKPKEEDATNEYTVSTQSIKSLVSVSGQVRSEQSQSLSFGSPGIVKQLRVTEGSVVNQGDLIAQLDTTPLHAQLQGAQGALQSASSNYSKVRDSMDIKLQEINTLLASNEADLAQATYNTTLNISENSIDRAEINVEIGEQNLDNFEDSNENLELEIEQIVEVNEASEDISIDSTTRNLAEERSELSDIQNEERLKNSEVNLDVQELRQEQTEIDFENSELNASQSNKVSQTSLERARANFEMAQIQRQQLSNNKKFDLGSIGGQISQAKSNVSLSQYNLSNASIYAPFSGTVFSIPFKEGEYYTGPGAGGAIKLADTSRFIAELEVNELDILSIEVEQKVLLELEAAPEKIFDGKVVKINPAPFVDQSGVTNYMIEVEILSKDIKIYEGLSIDAEIITDEKESVLSIPSFSVRQNEEGSYVNVKQGEEIIEKIIITGIEGDINIEVLEGLSEGDVIVY